MVFKLGKYMVLPLECYWERYEELLAGNGAVIFR